MNAEMSDQNGARHGVWLKAASLVSLTLGLGLGLLTLGAVAGIWFGLWDFRRGFSLLGIANTYGAWVAWVCVAISLVVLAASRMAGVERSARLVTLAILGAATAWIAYLVPESYRPAEGVSYPPIHDISTDPADPPEFKAIVPLRADAPNTLEYGGSEGMTPQRLAELTEEAYPGLDTQRYEMPVEDTFTRALAVVEELGWALVAKDASAGRIEATDTTFWFRFKDDVVIRIRAGEENGSVVDARSVSRVGRGDVGANARRLEAFFELMEQ